MRSSTARAFRAHNQPLQDAAALLRADRHRKRQIHQKFQETRTESIGTGFARTHDRIGNPMKRGLLLFALCSVTAFSQKPFHVVEATIPEMRAAMEQKRLTSRGL